MPKATQGERPPPIPAGVQHAICYQVIDIGTQPQQGNFPARRQVMIVWELPNERITVQREGHPQVLPRAISRNYSLSTDKKSNLRRDLEAWRGRPFTADEAKAFEVATIVGANCQLNIVHKPSADGSVIYANVAGIMPLTKGTARLGPENPTLVFDIPKDGPITFPAGMPEWIQNKIKNSEEYQRSINPERHHQHETEGGQAFPTGGPDEDVPF